MDCTGLLCNILVALRGQAEICFRRLVYHPGLVFEFYLCEMGMGMVWLW